MALNYKRMQEEALATINAAQTMLNRYPNLDLNNISINASTSMNPIPFLVNIMKSTGGYDMVIKWLARIIAVALPAVEVAIKAQMISHIRNMFTCSFNPMIPDDLLLNGLVFPLDQIDIANILQYSPMKPKLETRITDVQTFDKNGNVNVTETTTVVDANQQQDFSGNAWDWSRNIISTAVNRSAGSYYYFGCDKMYPDQLKDAGDFNAFLWYVKNRALNRTSWRGVKVLQSTVGDSAWTYSERDGNNYTVQKPKKAEDRKRDECEDVSKCKDRLGAGIVTLDYKDNFSSLRNAEGGMLAHEEFPQSNVLHVLLGCAEPIEMIGNNEDIEALEQLNNEMYRLQSESSDLWDKIQDKSKKINKLRNKYNKSKAEKQESLKKEIEKLKKQQNELETKYKAKKKEIEEKDKDIRVRKIGINTQELHYKPISMNYFYGHTLVEFNFEYISSLKLLDANVVIAELIDALTGCLSLDLNLSYERRVMQEEIRRMVQAVIESDETEISDCFFTFTNEGYNEMLRKVELMQAGLYSDNHGHPFGNSVPSVDSLLGGLNDITPGSSQEKIQSVIESSLFNATGELKELGPETVEENFQVNYNIVETVLSNLAYVIVSIIMSPKLYLLMAVNLKVLGKETSITPQEFIRTYKGLIKEIIRGVRDVILDKLFEYAKKLIIDLTVGEAKLLAQEQINYYKRTLRKCIECFRRQRGNLDFDVDNVNYADIIEADNSDTQQNNC